MAFTSIDFIVFFPFVLLIYFVIPPRLRTSWLLVVSYFFYSFISIKFAVWLLVITFLTFVGGLAISNLENQNMKRVIALLVLMSNLLILVVFKYVDFFIEIINEIGSQSIRFIHVDKLNLIVPVGMSFYTLQVIGYIVDVYKGKQIAERNFVKYALFVSFFPKLVSGPIEKSSDFLRLINCVEKFKLWDIKRIRDGVLLMLWGYFLKLAIADRASILVTRVYDNYSVYGFIELFIASVLFSIQIYCDFLGYTSIARGAAKVLGFSLIQNFRQPYLANSFKDFWRRWHISLTQWFTEYIYIPLGGNRKGVLRKYLNIIIVFIISGLWHGASWNFIVWGLIHAVLQIIEDFKLWLIRKLRLPVLQKSFSYRLLKVAFVFLLVNFAWIFFASNSLSQAIGIVYHMFSSIQKRPIAELGLKRIDWQILTISLVILGAVDVVHELKKSVFMLMDSQMLYFKYAFYIGLFWGVIMFGVYGANYDTSQFIYARF